MFNLEEVFSKKDVNGSKPSALKKSGTPKDEGLPMYTYEKHLNKIAGSQLKTLLD